MLLLLFDNKLWSVCAVVGRANHYYQLVASGHDQHINWMLHNFTHTGAHVNGDYTQIGHVSSSLFIIQWLRMGYIAT